MSTRRDLLILGDSAFPEIDSECFNHDSDHRGFAVEREFQRREGNASDSA